MDNVVFQQVGAVLQPHPPPHQEEDFVQVVHDILYQLLQVIMQVCEFTDQFDTEAGLQGRLKSNHDVLIQVLIVQVVSVA